MLRQLLLHILCCFRPTRIRRGHSGSALKISLHFIRSVTACVACATVLCAGAAPGASNAPQLKLRVVGGLGGLHQYTRHEEPFWSQELARLSQGKYAASIVPFDRAGVPGSDMLRLIELGVVPFGTTLMSSLQTTQPHLAASDLAALSPDMAHLRQVVAASRSLLETRLRTDHHVEMLALYVYPAQVLFCRQPFVGLTDLKGRRIRVSSLTQADFFQALGASTVHTAFAQIKANFMSGDIDCAVTGTMSGYTLGLHQVSSHIHTLPITWGLAIFAAHKTTWDNLPPDLKALLRHELGQLESAIWAESERETAEGLACNTGAGPCPVGPAGHMTSVALSPADEQLRQTLFTQTVLPRWLARCGTACDAVWAHTADTLHLRKNTP